jgi:ABC-type spermidine/putrescine transport system permease subunit I
MSESDPVTQTQVISQYNWNVNTTTLDVGITLQFSQDTMWGQQFGLTNDWPLGAAMSVILLLITAMFLAVLARITRTEGTLD